MQTAVLDGLEIAYRVPGRGAPVILIHAAGLADFFTPLADSDLLNPFQKICYHRVGFGR